MISDEVLRRIDFVSKSKSDVLDLGGLSLDSFPKELYNLTWLKELYLGYDKKVRNTPPLLRSVQDKTLCNKLTKLPEEICKFSHLEILGLEGNQLTEIPKEIELLSSLKELKLGDNHLNELPVELGSLSKLQKLFLKDNRLSKLPSQIGNLQSLQFLDLNSNQLLTLPSEIGQLRQLEKIWLESNKIESLPNEISKLGNLKELWLRFNRLTELPSTIGNLFSLEGLWLKGNELHYLPSSIGKLPSVKKLGLGNNRLKKLPIEIGELITLEELTLENNILSSLPSEIKNLKNLQALRLENNQISKLPPQIGQLESLNELGASGNVLTELPNEIGTLKNLRSLFIENNQLRTIPTEIGKLDNLQNLNIHNNKFDENYFDARRSGVENFLSFIRGLSDESEELYEAKLILTGEGRAGKTCLIKALRGEDASVVSEDDRTYGVELGKLDLNNPDHSHDPAKMIRFNTWDFGGQDVYKKQHIFFTTDAIYLLVYDPTGSDNDRKVETWLRLIHLYAGSTAKIILVATHCPRIGRKFQPGVDLTYLSIELQELIVAEAEVDSLTKDGIKELKVTIAEHAQKLPHMGNQYPAYWYKARNSILDEAKRNEVNHISYSSFKQKCIDLGIPSDQVKAMALLFMHGLGSAIYYGDDHGDLLSNIIILNAEWLTKAIVQVFENDFIRKQNGILDHSKDLKEVWKNHSRQDWKQYKTGEFPYLLELMHEFDISFVIPDTDRKKSLIAQLVQIKKPDISNLWEEKCPDLNQLKLICKINERIHNLIPKLIVRTFADHVNQQLEIHGEKIRAGVYWQYGLLLEDAFKNMALIKLQRNDGRDILSLEVRGPCPNMFFWPLYRTIDRVLRSWPGLQKNYRYAIPCTNRNSKNEVCFGNFPLETLLKCYEQKISEVRCGRCLTTFPPSELLIGFEMWSAQIKVKESLKEFSEGISDIKSKLYLIHSELKQGQESQALMQQALFTYQEAICPRLFSIMPIVSEKKINNIISGLAGTKYRLTLYCEKTLEEVKTYEIRPTSKWLRKILPFLRFAAGALGSNIPIFETKGIASDIGMELGVRDLRRVEGADMRILKEFMEEHNIAPEYGGMRPLTLSDGNTYWLSKSAYERYKHDSPFIDVV